MWNDKINVPANVFVIRIWWKFLFSKEITRLPIYYKILNVHKNSLKIRNMHFSPKFYVLSKNMHF